LANARRPGASYQSGHSRIDLSFGRSELTLYIDRLCTVSGLAHNCREPRGAGELSGGVNLFKLSQTTAVFAKVDYNFGEDVHGVGGKGGVRVAW
jgi:hypothetical protein